MSRRDRVARKGPAGDRRGLTNGNGPLRPAGLTNGLGHTNGTGRSNGLTNGLTNGVRGRTNGLTNGLAARTNGLTNGLANGSGRTNGLTNGTGRTNGAGVINGLINGSYRRGLRQNRYGVITQRDLRVGVSIIVLFLLLLGPFYLLMSTPPTASLTRITVDGNLADWDQIAFLADTVSSRNNDVKLTGYSAIEENGYLSFAIRVAGIALGDPTGLDGFYVFIDKDGSASSGFKAREIGAEYMIAIRGGDNRVTSAALYSWPPGGADPANWTAWQQVDSVRAASSADGVEVQLQPRDVDLVAGSHAFLVGATDYEGNDVLGSVHFDETRKALLVRQDPASAIVATTGQPFASLTLAAFGAPVVVTRVSMTRDVGTGNLPSLNNFTVSPGTSVRRDVPVTFTSGDLNTYVRAHVTPASVVTSGNVPVTVDGPDVVAYLGSAPATHRVEGYFGDWTQTSLDTGTPPSDPNVDIANYGANRTASTAFVYADVAGRMFGGSGTPEQFVRPTGGGGGQGSPGVAMPRKGEDIFVAYIDVDTSRPVGTMAYGVRADFKIEIHGIHGRPTSWQGSRWTGSAWTTFGAVSVANDRQHMEASLDLGSTPTGTMAMAIVATDWQLLSDASGVFNFLDLPAGGGTRASDLPITLDAPDPQEITATPLDATPSLDGVCGASEYSGGGVQDLGNLTLSVGLDGGYLYACGIVKWDTSSSLGDYGVIVFDRSHDGGLLPRADDRRFWINLTSSTVWTAQGNGVTWVNCADCAGTDAAQATFVGSHPNYEFKIAEADVVVPGNVTAGFAFVAFNGENATFVRWGSTSALVEPNIPASWGHITVPEFSDLLAPVLVVGVIYFIARRRRRDADP